MKSNIKRFLGFLLAAMMVVTILPVTSFAEDITDDTVVDEPVIEDSVSDVPSGASFVIDDKTFILMDSTMEIDGKTYYGILSKEKLSYAWYHATPYMETDDGVIDMDNEVTLYVMDDRQYDFENKTISEDKRTDIQSFVTKFAPFGDFVAPEDTVWTLHQGNADIGKVYFKGSVGLPTANQLNAVLATDELPFGSDESRYLVQNVGFWNGVYYWSRLQPGANPSNANFFINNIAGLTASNGGGGTWYFMTYVSEDFFKTTKLDVPTVGIKARETLAANFYQRDFAAAGYTEEELAELGILAQPDDSEASIEWSPNYAKFAGLDLLFNNTITKDGKTYFGFTWAKDFGGSNISSGLCSIELTSPATDYDGNPMPSKNYGSMDLTTGDRTNLGSFEAYISSTNCQMLLQITF